MSGATRRRCWFALAVLVSMVLLFSPGSTVPGEGPPGLDKLVHASIFAVLALTGRRARVPVAPLAAALLGYAAVSEILQASLPIHRDGTWLDAVADAVGIAVGTVLAARTPRRG